MLPLALMPGSSSLHASPQLPHLSAALSRYVVSESGESEVAWERAGAFLQLDSHSDRLSAAVTSLSHDARGRRMDTSEDSREALLNRTRAAAGRPLGSHIDEARRPPARQSRVRTPEPSGAARRRCAAAGWHLG